MESRLTGCGGLVVLAGIVLGLAGSALPARATLAPDVGSYGTTETSMVVLAPPNTTIKDGGSDGPVSITGFPSAQQVPEPASALTGLLGMGLLSLVAWRRRRKRRPPPAGPEEPREVG